MNTTTVENKEEKSGLTVGHGLVVAAIVLVGLFAFSQFGTDGVETVTSFHIPGVDWNVDVTK